jgi:hypothetical protein
MTGNYGQFLDVICMVYPSGHGHIVTTENLGICTSRGSHTAKQPEHPDDL